MSKWRAVHAALFDDPRFATLEEHARILYLRILVHDADSHGRCVGHPAVLRGPLSHRTVEEVVAALRALHLSDLIYWYADPDPDRLGRHSRYVQICNFDRDQPNRYIDGSGESRIPGADSGHVEAFELFDDVGGVAVDRSQVTGHVRDMYGTSTGHAESTRKKERKKERTSVDH